MFWTRLRSAIQSLYKPLSNKSFRGEVTHFCIGVSGVSENRLDAKKQSIKYLRSTSAKKSLIFCRCLQMIFLSVIISMTNFCLAFSYISVNANNSISTNNTIMMSIFIAIPLIPAEGKNSGYNTQ